MPRHNAAEAMPAPDMNEPQEKKKKNHLKLVEEIPDLTHEAVYEPTLAEEATAHMIKEKAEPGAAAAKGREAQAIREAQAQLAHAAVDELIEEQKGQEEQAMKAPAKIATRWERFKNWFRGKS